MAGRHRTRILHIQNEVLDTIGHRTLLILRYPDAVVCFRDILRIDGALGNNALHTNAEHDVSDYFCYLCC